MLYKKFQYHEGAQSSLWGGRRRGLRKQGWFCVNHQLPPRGRGDAISPVAEEQALSLL